MKNISQTINKTLFAINSKNNHSINLYKPKDDKKNICFLDIDGVLQPLNNQYRFDHDMNKTIEYLSEKYSTNIFKTMNKYDVCATYYDWSNIAIGYLREFLDKTCSYIVLHSNWRTNYEISQIKALFMLYGLEDYVLDKVNDQNKPIAIQMYLDEHKNEIDKYVILDDVDYAKYFGLHSYKTNDYLKENDFKYLINLFRYHMTSYDDNETITLYRNNTRCMEINSKIIDIDGDKIVCFNIQNIDDIPFPNECIYIVKELLKAKSIDTNIIGYTTICNTNKPYLNNLDKIPSQSITIDSKETNANNKLICITNGTYSYKTMNFFYKHKYEILEKYEKINFS